MERVTQALAHSALTEPAASLQKSLSSEDSTALLAMLDSLTRRYPSVDLAESMEDYEKDFAALAVEHGLPRVMAAVERLRIRPGQKFFPRPDEVADEIEAQREALRVPGLAETKRRLEEEEAERQRILTDPQEVAFRRAKFGYDPLTEKEPGCVAERESVA